LIYDIPNDGARNKVADLCLDYGLERIQYSAFEGELKRTHQEELVMRIKKRLGKQAGDVRLVPICEKDWAARLEVMNESANPQVPSGDQRTSESVTG
jgi:CRISPR-associated protein Cas2